MHTICFSLSGQHQKALLIICSGICWIAACLILAGFTSAHGADPIEQMEIPSSFNPVGSGARALGMGGAFIAIADDATAASWNPGGLIQLENPEISIVMGYTHRRENNTFGEHPEANGTQTIDERSLNYLSLAWPFQQFGRNMIVSLNYQKLYDFHRDWRFEYDKSLSDLSGWHLDTPWDFSYDQDGALYALGLAYSIQITPEVSVGATLNYWGDTLFENRWTQKYRDSGQISSYTEIDYDIGRKDEYAFEGWNANFGFLWSISQHWAVGGVFKTPFKADITHTVDTDYQTLIPSEPEDDLSIQTHDQFSEKLTMPMAYGLGVAYRMNDTFTVSMDIYRTHWNDFEMENAEGDKTSAINGQEDADIDPTTSVRIGCEYLFIRNTYVAAFRGGLFYDPAPSTGSPDDYYGLSLGAGFFYKRFAIDIAYQFRFGNEVGSSAKPNSDFAQDVQEHTVYSSAVVHF